MEIRPLICVCLVLTVNGKNIPGHFPQRDNDKKPGFKIAPAKPLAPHHVLLKEVYKTARNLQADKVHDHVLLLDFNTKMLPGLLLDINPKSKDIIKNLDIDKGTSIIPVLSDILCKACKEKGDVECIKRHCLPDGTNGNDRDVSTVPILADILCKACKNKDDFECIKRHCLKEGTKEPSIILPRHEEHLERHV